MKPFCDKPWTEISYSPNGIRPCCVWEGSIYKGNLKDYNESRYLKRIQKAMIRHNMDVLNDSCSNCIENEKQNFFSPRRPTRNKKLQLFEYWPSNICNLKCIMCNASASNLIEEEETKLGLREYEPKSITDITEFDFSDVEILKIFGGEPTAGIHTMQQLQSVIDSGYADKLKLAYTTNATSYSKMWSNIVNQFASRDVGISIDGTGKILEYIRQNAKWDKIYSNLDKIIQDSTTFKFSIVLQTTSFILVDKWIDFFFDYKMENVGMYQLYDVPGRLTAIPDDIKVNLILKLETKNHPLSDKVISILENTKFDVNELKAYKEYILMLDRRRGTNIYNLDPIFEDILARV